MCVHRFIKKEAFRQRWTLRNLKRKAQLTLQRIIFGRCATCAAVQTKNDARASLRCKLLVGCVL